MDNETLQIILEFVNKASPEAKALLDDLKRLNKEVAGLQKHFIEAGLDSKEAMKMVQAASRELSKKRVQIKRQEDAEFREINRNNLKEYRKHLKDEESALKESVKRKKAIIASGMQVLGGASSIAGGVSSAGSAIMSVFRQVSSWVQKAINEVQALAGFIIREIGEAFDFVKRNALLAGAAFTAIGGIVAKIGIDFDQFKQNARLTLEQLTGGSKRAGKIIKDAFDLSIPAKFTFDEILEGMRTVEAFGVKADAVFKGTKHTVSELAVALAQGMEKPLSQVTRFLGNLSQGRLLLQQAAPLGLGRNTLKQFGAEFDAHGSPKDREKLMGAALRAIEARWGGFIEKMASSYESALDSMVSHTRVFFGKLTEGLFGSLSVAFRSIGNTVKRMFESTDPVVQGFVKALKMPFDLLGKAVEFIAAKLPDILNYLSQFVTVKNIENVFSHIATVVQILFDEFMRFVNILTGGKSVWGSFEKAARAALDIIYRGWNGFLAGLEYLVQNSDKIWGAFTSAAQAAFKIILLLIGIVAVQLKAQILKAFAEAAKGAADIIGGIWNAIQTIMKFAPAAAMAAMSSTVKAGGIGGGMMNLGAHVSQSPFGPTKDEYEKFKAEDNAARDKSIRESQGPKAGSNSLGPIPDWLIGNGQDALNKLFAMINAMIPKDVKDFGKGFGDAVQRGATHGIDEIAPKYDSYFRTNHSRLVQFYEYQFKGRRANGAAGTGDEIAPGHQMFSGGGDLAPSRDPSIIDALIEEMKAQAKGYDSEDKPAFKAKLIPLLKEKITSQVAMVRALMMEAAVPTNEEGEAKSEDDRKEEAIKIIKAREDYWKTFSEIATIQREAGKQVFEDMKAVMDAQEEAIKAQVDILPESQRAAALYERELPIWQQKQKVIADQLKNVRQGSEEFYKLQADSAKIQKEIVDAQNAAAEQAQKAAFETPTRQFSTLRKLISMLPKGAQRGAMQKLLVPRIFEAFKAAGHETDPLKRQDQLLSVVDLFTQLKDDSHRQDPFQGFFGEAMAGQRSLALQGLRRSRFGRRAVSRSGRSATGNLLAAMGPFGPMAPGGGGAAGMNGDNLTQIIVNLPPNPTDQQIADAIMRALGTGLDREYGRR